MKQTLKIRNFKSIGNNTQTIELNRINLLFGENNVGKSTVIDALGTLSSLLQRKNTPKLEHPYEPYQLSSGFGGELGLGNKLTKLKHSKSKQSEPMILSLEMSSERQRL